MSSYPFDVHEASQSIRVVLYKLKCEALVIRWYGTIDYTSLEDWFDSNRCCLPICLSRALRNGKEYIKENTTI